MEQEAQCKLLSPIRDLDAVRILLADLHDDLLGKVARFHQISDLSEALGSKGAMMPGGELAFTAWIEARASFIHGNYVATVLLCQGLAEHMLAAYLSLGINGEEIPNRITFRETLSRCMDKGLITQKDVDDLQRLMELRNPLSHFRGLDDPSNLSRRTLNTGLSAESHLLNDASFAISMAIRLLALSAFRLGP